MNCGGGQGRRQVSASSCGVRATLRISVNDGLAGPDFLCVYPNMRGSYPRNCFTLPCALA